MFKTFGAAGVAVLVVAGRFGPLAPGRASPAHEGAHV